MFSCSATSSAPSAAVPPAEDVFGSNLSPMSSRDDVDARLPKAISSDDGVLNTPVSRVGRGKRKTE